MIKKSAKFDYACRAIFELALHWPNEQPLRVPEIAKRQGIPLNFLIQILFNLKQLGLVRSSRGKEGGYILTRPPKEIRFNELAKLFGHESEKKQSRLTRNKKENILDTVWSEVDVAVENILENISFEDICNRARESAKTITYEI